MRDCLVQGRDVEHRGSIVWIWCSCSCRSHSGVFVLAFAQPSKIETRTLDSSMEKLVNGQVCTAWKGGKGRRSERLRY